MLPEEGKNPLIKSAYFAWVSILIGQQRLVWDHCWNQSFLLYLLESNSAIVHVSLWVGQSAWHRLRPCVLGPRNNQIVKDFMVKAPNLHHASFFLFFINPQTFVSFHPLCFMGMLWTCEVDSHSFATKKTIVMWCCLLHVLHVFLKCGRELGGNSWRYILANERAESLVLQPHTEPSLYFRNMFPYFPIGQFW